jgi:hypothetical protein
MQAVKDRDGIPQSEQVRRAIREWLERRGALAAPVHRPDADFKNADWPKQTADIDTTGRAVRAAVPTYLRALPTVVPSGKVLVHSHVRPTRTLGSRGFRAWLSSPDPTTLEVCGCDWAPGLGQHFRVRAIKDVKIDDGRVSVVYEPRQPRGRGKR